MMYPIFGISTIMLWVLLVTAGDSGVDSSFSEDLHGLFQRYKKWCFTSSFMNVVKSGSPHLITGNKSEHQSRFLLRLHLSFVFLGFIGAVITRSLLGFVVAVVFGILVLWMRGKQKQRTESQVIIQQLPDVFRTMGMMLASGKTLMQACAYISEQADGKIAEVFGSCAISMQLGEGRENALHTLTTSLNIPYMKLVTCSIEVSQLTGAPLQDLLYKTAELLEEQQKTSEYIRVKTSQAQASVKIVIFLPIVIITGLLFMSPEFRSGLTTVGGIAALGFAAFLDALAVIVIRHLMRGVERDVIS